MWPCLVTLELPLVLPLADMLSAPEPPLIDCGGDNVAFLNLSDVRSIPLSAAKITP